MVTRTTFASREEWLEARRQRIGGSDAACILGLNPYKSNVQLWQEKMGQLEPKDISENELVRYGTQAEPFLRELFKLDHPELTVFYEPDNIWFNDRFPFAHASLDGWFEDKDGRKGVFECKTSTITNSAQAEKWNHRVPMNYYIQICWYLGVTEFDLAILRAQLKFSHGSEVYIQIREYTIERQDVEEDIGVVMDAGREFAEAMRKGVCPPLELNI